MLSVNQRARANTGNVPFVASNDFPIYHLIEAPKDPCALQQQHISLISRCPPRSKITEIWSSATSPVIR